MLHRGGHIDGSLPAAFEDENAAKLHRLLASYWAVAKGRAGHNDKVAISDAEAKAYKVAAAAVVLTLGQTL